MVQVSQIWILNYLFEFGRRIVVVAYYTPIVGGYCLLAFYFTTTWFSRLVLPTRQSPMRITESDKGYRVALGFSISGSYFNN
jgi:hypothetical protein